MTISGPGDADRSMQIDLFQLVGLVEMLELEEQVISAQAKVPQDHSIFAGHFPGHPLMPGVLLTEMMAQTCGFLLLSLNKFSAMPLLAALKEVKLRDFVTPGTDLICEAKCIHGGTGYAVLTASIRRQSEEKRVCDGTLMFRIVPYPNDQLSSHMLQRARAVGLSICDGDVVSIDEGRR